MRKGGEGGAYAEGADLALWIGESLEDDLAYLTFELRCNVSVVREQANGETTAQETESM